MKAAQTSSQPPAWSGRTRGGYLGNWFFIQAIRFLGLRFAYCWLVFVAGYFTLASPSSFRFSAAYLKRVLGPQAFWKLPLLVYRHFFSFGVTLLDRMAVIMGCATMECQFDGEEILKQQLAQNKGLILVSAHLGAWEMGGHLLSGLGRPVNLVVLEKEEARVRSLFDRALAQRRFNLLTTDGHPLRSIPIVAALRRGEVVALHGDRSFGGADLAVPFMGSPARFPVGPYMLAAISGAPLVSVFVLRERLGRYRFFSFKPKFLTRDLLRTPESPELKNQVSAYAQTLESVARQYPFQWYNIYKFWA